MVLGFGGWGRGRQRGPLPWESKCEYDEEKAAAAELRSNYYFKLIKMLVINSLDIYLFI